MTRLPSDESSSDPCRPTTPPESPERTDESSDEEKALAEQALLKSQKIDCYLSNLFLQIGVPANRNGFQYLREAVRLVLLEPSLQNRLMHGLYPLVAEQCNSSVYCVEHSLRCAIMATWERGRPDLVEKLLGRNVVIAYARPTNGEMIALLAENVRVLLREGKL